MTVVRENRGFHPTIETELPYIFVDTCVQIWPDADLPNAHRHGVTVYGVTAWLPHPTLDQALEGLMYWRLMERRHPNLLVAESVDDIRRARAEGRAVLLLAAQDGDFIGDKLHRIEAFYRLGLRMMLPAYNRSSLICDGCLDRTDGGLTNFGQLVVDECNRVGLLLDCTHIGRRASLEIIDRSARPCVFSHSNPNALVENPRNITDEQIKACAARGGVIGLAPWGPLLFKPESGKRPTLDDYIDHIDYVAQLLGNTRHIGVGTDFSLGSYPPHSTDPWGVPSHLERVAGAFNRTIAGNVRSPLRFAAGFDSYPEVVNLVEGLQQRGYDEQSIANLLGENFLRVFSEVWV